MLGVPATTPYDWNFSLFGFPVRVAPWFWVAMLVLGGGNGATKISIAAFAAAVFISILIHELGHTFAFRHYGQESRIVLYHFGGLAVPTGGRPSNNLWEHIVISAAGPVVQMAAAILLAVVLRSFGIGTNSRLLHMIGFRGGEALSNPFASEFLLQFYWVSIGWALFNLLPVYPLDGGQISRSLFQIFAGHNGINYSLMLSVATGGLLAVYAFKSEHILMAMFFGSFAYNSYQAMQAYGAGPRRW